MKNEPQIPQLHTHLTQTKTQLIMIRKKNEKFETATNVRK